MAQNIVAASEASTGINTQLLHNKVDQGAGFAGANVVDDQNAKFAQNVRMLLGDKVDLRYLMNMGPMTTYNGHSHSTTGIPYAINGTARVISQKVAVWLAGFEDPIKAVLGTAVVREQKIIITRKYVVGGSALITPERAPARTVSVKEDAREEILCRYGGDLEMNLNLFLRPELAQEELSMKLEAQRDQLQQVLVSLGYEKIMNQGAGIVQAIQRASALSGMKNEKDRAIQADRIFASAIFGALNKHMFPVQNLMATLSKCNIYTPNAGSGSRAPSVMLVPPGTFDLSKFGEKSEMMYSVSGLSKDNHGQISLPLKNVFTEPSTGLRVLVHFPAVSNQFGAAHPQVVNNELARNVGIATYYEPKETKHGSAGSVDANADLVFPELNKIEVTDFRGRRWATVEQVDKDGNDPKAFDQAAVTKSCTAANLGDSATPLMFFLLRPNMVCHMHSAIFCADPGTNTGDLVYAYPSTAVSTSQTTESLRMQLRVYCGAVIKQPENIIVMNDVQCAGVVSGHGNKCFVPDPTDDTVKYDPTVHDFIIACKKRNTPWTDLFFDETFKRCLSVKEVFGDEITQATPTYDGSSSNSEKRPVVPYRGASRTLVADKYQYTTNDGHLGALDDPEMTDVIEGYQVYNEAPLATKQVRHV